MKKARKSSKVSEGKMILTALIIIVILAFVILVLSSLAPSGTTGGPVVTSTLIP